MGSAVGGIGGWRDVAACGHVDLADRHGETLMDAFVFNGAGGAVKNVMVGGKWVVRDGRHHEQEAIEARFRAVQKRLLAAKPL